MFNSVYTKDRMVRRIINARTYCGYNHITHPHEDRIKPRWTLQWRHNGRDNVSNHQPHDCLRKCLFRRRSKKTSKLRVTGLCAGNSPGTGEFPAQMASNAENVSIWWRHHEHQHDVFIWAQRRCYNSDSHSTGYLIILKISGLWCISFTNGVSVSLVSNNSNSINCKTQLFVFFIYQLIEAKGRMYA